MSTTVKRSYTGRPEDWPVPQMPDLTGREPWRTDISAFWLHPIDQAPVDRWRTDLLSDFDIVVSCVGGNKPYMGTTYGMPFQLVSAQAATTTVWDLSRSVTWQWFRPTYPHVQLPLPELVLRGGDPGEAFDMHWIGYDPDMCVLYEVIQLKQNPLNRLKTFNTTDWTLGYTYGSYVAWNTRIPWNDSQQIFKRGVCAAGVPMLPLAVRYEEIVAGRINHTLGLVLPNYANTHIPPALGHDGDLDPTKYPLRAGDRIRLKRDVVTKVTDPVQRIMAEAAREFGMMVVDRSAHDTGRWEGTGGFTLTMDCRWQTVDLPQWRLSDFEVIQ